MQHLRWHSDLTKVLDDWAKSNKKRHIVISPVVKRLTSATIPDEARAEINEPPDIVSVRFEGEP